VGFAKRIGPKNVGVFLGNFKKTQHLKNFTTLSLDSGSLKLNQLADFVPPRHRFYEANLLKNQEKLTNTGFFIVSSSQIDHFYIKKKKVCQSKIALKKYLNFVFFGKFS